MYILCSKWNRQLGKPLIINICTFFVQNETDNWVNHWYIAKTVEALILFLGEYHTSLDSATFWKGTFDKTFLSIIIQIGGKIFTGNTWYTIKIYNLDNRISWSTVSNAFLRSRKVTGLTLPISTQASNKAVTAAEWSTWNPDWCLDN